MLPITGETKKKFKDPSAFKRPPTTFSLFCSEYWSKLKGEHPALLIGSVAKRPGEMWKNTAADDKQPHERKATWLRGKMKRISLHTPLKGSLMQQKRESSKLKKTRQRKTREMRKTKKMRRKMKMMMMSKLVLAQFFLLSIKDLIPCTQLAPFKEKN